MINFRTIKAKECCCGCTLRTGSLILLWIVLVADSIATLYYLTEVLYGNTTSRYARTTSAFAKIRSCYFLIWSIAGIITSLLGIFGIQKNIPTHLTFSMFYFLFYVIHFLLSLVLAWFFPTAYKAFILAGTNISYVAYGAMEFLFVVTISYIFLIALMLYFTLIIKSCRDSMSKNLATSTANEIPDPIAVGYNSAY